MNSSFHNMSDQSVVVVEECPPPPFYYKLFDDNLESTIFAPPIPSLGVLSNKLPFRNVSNINLSETYPNMDKNVDENFKLLLKRSLKKILEESLQLASNIPPTISTNSIVLKLNESITDILVMLKSYRDHESREVLCEELKLQVQKAREMEEQLKMCLEKSELHLKAMS